MDDVRKRKNPVEKAAKPKVKSKFVMGACPDVLCHCGWKIEDGS